MSEQDKFWIVINVSSDYKLKRHESYLAADKEAQRLASRQPGDKFVVFTPSMGYQGEVQVNEIRLIQPVEKVKDIDPPAPLEINVDEFIGTGVTTFNSEMVFVDPVDVMNHFLEAVKKRQAIDVGWIKTDTPLACIIGLDAVYRQEILDDVSSRVGKPFLSKEQVAKLGTVGELVSSLDDMPF